jgi:hypothetical protein
MSISPQFDESLNERTAILSAIHHTPLPKYSKAANRAETADLTACEPIYLGVLLESSEYDIVLPHSEYYLIHGTFNGCLATIQNLHLKIITHELNSILYQELTLYGVLDYQKISFYIVPNLFDLSCQT